MSRARQASQMAVELIAKIRKFEHLAPAAAAALRDSFMAESRYQTIAPGRPGVVRAESTPLHRGKRTQVWQTRVTDGAGRLLSLTTQTQMVLTT